MKIAGGLCCLWVMAAGLRHGGSASQQTRLMTVMNILSSPAHLQEFKKQSMDAMEGSHKEAVEQSFNDHIAALERREYRQELHDGVSTAIALLQEIGNMEAGSWTDDEITDSID